MRALPDFQDWGGWAVHIYDSRFRDLAAVPFTSTAPKAGDGLARRPPIARAIPPALQTRQLRGRERA